MPGILLSASPRPDGPLATDRFARALELMRFDARYDLHHVSDDPSIRLAWTGYPGYPVAVHREAGFTLLIEGKVYASPFDLRATLVKDARHGLDPDVAVEIVERFIEGADGDFLIAIIIVGDPPSAIVAADMLGRLPLYWSFQAGTLTVAREVKAVAALADRHVPDQHAIAETLIFAFPLADRTLLTGVQRLLPGGILRWPAPSASRVLVRTRAWDFTEQPASQLAFRDAVEQCADRIIESCRKRLAAFPDNRFVLSLSGGLDSRMAAAALQRLSAKIDTRTFLYEEEYRDFEADCARRVAESLGFSWESHRIAAPEIAERQRHVTAYDGLNTAALAFSDPYLRGLMSDSPPAAILIGGAGGDLILPPRHPHRHLRTSADIADLLLYRNATWPLESVAALTGQPAGDIRGRLLAHIDGFPEPSPAARYLQFCLLDIEFKKHFVGEDRNRHYLWTLAPFYAHPLFTWAMHLPYTWKRYRKFNLAVLRALNPDLLRIPSANTGIKPGVAADRARQRLRDWTFTHPTAERWLRKWRSRKRPSLSDWAHAQAALLTRIQESRHADTSFDPDHVRSILAAPLSESQFWLLFTVAHYLRTLDESE